MPKISKIIILTVFVLFLACLGIFVFAGTDDNISGFAYSENIGWVSFNSVDCDIDGDGVFEGAGETGGPAPAGCPDSGTAFDYGVSVDLNTGALSGFAYSENIGWISFNVADLAGCSSGSCLAKVAPPGQIGKSDVDIEGWARACAGSVNGDCTGGDRTDGWDGWIKFDHGESGEPYIDTAGDWHGWAWGSDVVGWLSFNGVDPDAGGSYKVTLGQVNRAPTATGLGVVKGDYCSIPAHYFSWIYSDPDGDDQSKFQFQVDDDSDFTSLKIDRTATSTVASGDSNNQIVVVAVSPGSDQIGYNTTYYWRVKVWDSQDSDSGWICYGGDCPGTTFTTELHRYPSANADDEWFTWSPQNPSIEEDVQFTDESICYDINNNPADCVSWGWDFESDETIDSTEQNPVHQFTGSDTYIVTLWVADADGYTSSGSHDIGVQIGLPGWQEILPQ